MRKYFLMQHEVCCITAINKSSCTTFSMQNEGLPEEILASGSIIIRMQNTYRGLRPEKG